MVCNTSTFYKVVEGNNNNIQYYLPVPRHNDLTYYNDRYIESSIHHTLIHYIHVIILRYYYLHWTNTIYIK